METTNRIRRHLSGDRDYYRSLVASAAPITVQALISASLNLIDQAFVGGIGPGALAAVSLANSSYFVLAIFLFGVSSGVSVFVAQYWGKRDLEGVRRAAGLGLLLSLGLSLAFMAVTLAFPSALMRIFTDDPTVVDLGASFLLRIAPSYPLTAISFLFYGAMRSTEHARAPLLSTMVALGLNTALNYILIHGLLGFPKMGVVGSATATLVARVVELGITLWIVYGRRLPAAVRLRDVFVVKKEFFFETMRVSLPVMANEGFWVLGTTVYPAIYARMGTDVADALGVFSAIDRLAFVFAIGIGNATAALVGKQIGAGRRDLAYRYGGLSMVIAPITGLAVGALVFLARPLAMVLFGVSGAVRDNAMLLVALGAATLFLKSFSVASIVGVLRGGGDTLVAMLLDTVPMYVLSIPLALYGGLVLHWPLWAVYLAATSDELLKLVTSLARFLSKRWIHDLVNRREDAPAPAAIPEGTPSES